MELIKQEPIKEKSYVDMTQSRLMNPCLLNEKFKDITLLEDNQLLQLLVTDYSTVLNQVFENQNVSYLKLLKNNRFLNIFTHAVSYNISHSKPIASQDKIYMNKFVYDYLIHSEQDKMTKMLMISLSKIVNRDIIPLIISIGIPEELACSIAIARYSSKKEEINIQRVNYIILTTSLELMTEQMIIDLFGILYNKLSILFETIMFDRNIDNGNTEEEGEIYSRISNALLAYLENMPLEDTSTILKMYSTDYMLLHANEDVRFSLRSVNCEDYPRINQVIDSLIIKGEYIP